MMKLEQRRVHEELCRLAASKGAYDVDEARWLLEGRRAQVHVPLGYGSFFEYVERLFGYGPRLTSEKLRVAEALERLSALRDALAAGALAWSAARELTRVAVPDTEAEWLAAATGKTVRDVERMVSGRSPGDGPDDPAKPGAMRHKLRLDLSGDALAAWRDARNRLELEVGHPLDDDSFVRMLAQRAAGGDDDDGRAPYQVALTVCPQCDRATRDGAGIELEVEPAVLEAARCDAQHVGDTHVGTDRAAQTVPPRVRRQVLRRDHHRCQVPGCRAAKHIEVHHVIPRARRGGHDPSNLISLCSAHHAALHDGALRITGTAPGRLTFLHADGTVYGTPPCVARPALRVAPPASQVEVGRWPGNGTADRASTRGAPPAAVKADALSALRNLGIRARDAEALVRDAVGATVPELVRHALRSYAAHCREPAARYATGSSPMLR